MRPYLLLSCVQKLELSIMPKNTIVVTEACWNFVTFHSQNNAGPRILKMAISMESDIQQSPTKRDNLT